MKVLRNVIQYFTSKKRGALSEKKARAGDEQSEIKSSDHPTLVAKRRRSSESDLLSKLQQERKEHLKQCPDGRRFRTRAQAMSCASYFTEERAKSPYMKDRVLTENAKHLTPEQMHALEIDIFKPLDFYEILFDRMKTKDEAKRTNEVVHDMRTLVIMVNNAAG